MLKYHLDIYWSEADNAFIASVLELHCRRQTDSLWRLIANKPAKPDPVKNKAIIEPSTIRWG
jgi:hypothetical protein